MTLEELLNKLIEKGWKPYWWKNIKKATNEWWFCSFIRDSKKGFGWMSEISHRELASKESGLWQFVCENKLVKVKDKKVRFMYEDLERTQNYFSRFWYDYRLIESALTDEDKLEDFILSNIKVNEEIWGHY